MIFIGTTSFEKARPARTRAKKLDFWDHFGARGHARAREGARACGAHIVSKHFTFTEKRRALTRIGELWQCFGGGWGPLQNPKHGLKTSDASTNPQHGLRKVVDTPNWTRLGFCRGLRWPSTPVWDFVVASLGPKTLRHPKRARKTVGNPTHVLYCIFMCS